MANEAEKTNEPEREIETEDVKDSSEEGERSEGKIEIKTYIEMTLTDRQIDQKWEDRKQPRPCDEESYIVKLLKSLMNPQGSLDSAKDEEKK